MTLEFTEVLLILCLIVILKDVLLALLFIFNFKSLAGQNKLNNREPFVSVLIAARDEENNIRQCIESLQSQDYPVKKYEILVGNDRSGDETLQILQESAQRISNLFVFDIKILVQQRPGKMNVLAQLGEMAKGEILLFTDADTRLPASWIRTMVNAFQAGDGVVTGTTLLKAGTTFEKLQRIEWAHAISMMKTVSDLHINVSSIGNNMAITKEAYQAVGGYREIPFSITEDYEIYRQICGKGYSSFHIFESPVVATSVPQRSFKDLVGQRKRWMYGAFRLPFLMLILLILNTLYYALVILLLIFKFKLALVIVLLKIGLQTVFIILAFKKVEERVGLKDLLLYEIYAAIVNLWAFLMFILPIGVSWKGRKY